MDLFVQFRWRSSPGHWDLVASSLDRAPNQTSFQDALVSKHARSAFAYVFVYANAGWETLPISPDFERVPSASVVAGSLGPGRETMPIPPDCEHVPGSGVTASATDAGWESISIPPDRIHVPGAGIAAGAPDPEIMLIPSDCERVTGTIGDAGDLFFVRFYVDDSILLEVRFF